MRISDWSSDVCSSDLPAPGAVTGLHQLRSEELLHLAHQTTLPTLETSFERTIASVPAADLEPLVADTLSARRLPVPTVLNGLIARLKDEQDARALASRSEEHTSELQSLMRISYAVLRL